MASIYRITELGNAHRGGMNAAVDAEIRGIAKTNDASEFTIANELICARIGQTIGLPVPSGVLAEDAAKRLYYLSLDVSFEGKALPPVIPAEFATQEPWLAAGVVVFDVFIANGDRNRANLSRDPAFTIPRSPSSTTATLCSGPLIQRASTACPPPAMWSAARSTKRVSRSTTACSWTSSLTPRCWSNG